MHTILVADDSVTIQKAVEIVFDKEPFQVVKAGSGAEALARARDLKPALVLVDHLMPDKNGYEVAEALKADAATADIPVLILSGNTAPYDEGRARAAGVVGHLPKPFDCQTLLERVRTLLGVEATVHGTFVGAQPAVPSAAVSSMPRPPGFGGGRPPGGGVPVRAGVPAGVSGVPSATAASTSQPPVAKQDPFGFGASLGASQTPVASTSASTSAPASASAATQPPRPSTPASTFAASPFGASAVPSSSTSSTSSSTSTPISSPPMSTPAMSTPAMSTPAMSTPAMSTPASTSSPSISAASASSPPSSGKYAEAEFMEADIEVSDLTSSPPSASSASSSSSSPSATNVNPFGGNGAATVASRSTSKVDLQRLASLDSEASQAGSVVDKATSMVADRAGSAIAAATGAAPSREALGEEARQIVERIAWEVVPELAEVIIREEIQRLLKSRL